MPQVSGRLAAKKRKTGNKVPCLINVYTCYMYEIGLYKLAEDVDVDQNTEKDTGRIEGNKMVDSGRFHKKYGFTSFCPASRCAGESEETVAGHKKV